MSKDNARFNKVRLRQQNLLIDLGNIDPLVDETDDNGKVWLVCFFCADEAAAENEDVAHKPNCIWKRACNEAVNILRGRASNLTGSPPGQGRRHKRKKPDQPVTMPTTSMETP